jgi:hypothetical protein
LDIFEFFSSDVGKVALGGLIAFFGQVVVALIAWFREARVTSRNLHRDAEYLAIRVVLVLEELVGNAYNAVNDPIAYDEEGIASETVSDPDLVLPTDGNYKALPSQLMYRILSLPNRLNAVEEGKAAVAEHSGPPGYDEVFQYRIEELSKVGLEALAIIQALCNKYAIPQPVRPEHYDPEDGFKREMTKVQKR